MPRTVKGLVINRQPRNEDEAVAMNAQADALNLIAAKAGLVNYQRMTDHIWKRLLTMTKDKVDTYPEIDAALKEVIDRGVEGMLRVSRRVHRQ
jgi:hypothetical protein